MSEIHALIRDHGKQGALKRDVCRDVVEAAAGYMADEESGVGFIYSGWCQTALPHKRLADDAVWDVKSDRFSLMVEPGRRVMPSGERKWVGVPYGARARLILIYLQSEALRTNGPEVLLGKSIRAWLERVGIPVGGESVKMVRDQAERISRCKLTFEVARGNKVGLLNQSIVESALFTRDGRALFAETVTLSESFFRHLKKHPVPLDEAAIKQLANNSQALDIYAWLAYRLHVLKKPTPMTWASLKAQFGLGVTDPRNFRRLFLPNLALALAVYPDAKVEQTDTGLLLHPSRPPVAPKQFQVAVA